MTKYKAKPVTIDGIKFDSKAEAWRYSELKMLERGNHISHLELQPEYEVKIGGKLVCKYRGDFRYLDHHSRQYVVEDVKSPATAKNSTYRLKKKLVEAIYAPLKIVEVMK